MCLLSASNSVLFELPRLCTYDPILKQQINLNSCLIWPAVILQVVCSLACFEKDHSPGVGVRDVCCMPKIPGPFPQLYFQPMVHKWQMPKTLAGELVRACRADPDGADGRISPSGNVIRYIRLPKWDWSPYSLNFLWLPEIYSVDGKCFLFPMALHFLYLSQGGWGTVGQS